MPGHKEPHRELVEFLFFQALKGLKQGTDFTWAIYFSGSHFVRVGRNESETPDGTPLQKSGWGRMLTASMRVLGVRWKGLGKSEILFGNQVDKTFFSVYRTQR